ncbi:hypothetical protein J7T55_009742 [Diaporthe amygdali]|uniref:uncharacterized protein n=1 Tax=Phomopsis amygdali TaxID=1214568 RepID=UPI0022FE8CAA|nr:uncharacterized protein J7T55_009742 [Diaporthe amygdali]KAJ0116592.1 hypothetical protein J7T55_009742 [Diaporthe amygdali]
MGTSTPSYERSERNEDGELYADLRSYITRQRHAWSVTRDIEIAQPLQQRYMGFEAGLMEEIRQAERDNENKRRERAEEMEGATGLIKWSWRLYELRMRLCERWQRRRLRGNWWRNQLNAMKKELNGEYVRLQNGHRADMMKDMISFAGEETVEDADDGAYVWNGLLNYIVYGYETMFPISHTARVIRFNLELCAHDQIQTNFRGDYQLHYQISF